MFTRCGKLSNLPKTDAMISVLLVFMFSAIDVMYGQIFSVQYM